VRQHTGVSSLFLSPLWGCPLLFFLGVERRVVRLGMARRPVGARAPSDAVGLWCFLGGRQEWGYATRMGSVAVTPQVFNYRH
jgi:hypothetical protein